MALAQLSPPSSHENITVIACKKDLSSLKGVFDTCDVDRDGFLTLEELCEWMKNMGLQVTRNGLRELVHDCDRNHDGCLDFNEFVTLCGSLGLPSPADPDDIGTNPRSATPDLQSGVAAEADSETDEDLQQAFRVFDKDSNGLISATELRSTLSQLGLLAATTSFSRIQSMIRRVDSDGDGEVNFSEFQDMMKGFDAK